MLFWQYLFLDEEGIFCVVTDGFSSGARICCVYATLSGICKRSLIVWGQKVSNMLMNGSKKFYTFIRGTWCFACTRGSVLSSLVWD